MSDEKPVRDDETTRSLGDTPTEPLPDRPMPTEEQPPTLESSRYRIGTLIGEGGMALVHEAEDTNLGRTVAIKTMREDVASSKEMRWRFTQEAEILAELAHPGTLPVHDAGVLESGQPFYAMERVHGRTLSEILASRESSKVEDTGTLLGLVDIFERICQTLAYAHSRRIVHRDLKPANIMVDKFGALAVMDWGIARRIVPEDEDTERTKAGVVMGTPGFMSPEQTEALADAHEQTDVFALGVILYEILTAERPFRGASARELAFDVMHHDPQPPKGINPGCPRELSAICLKALAKDPRRRYRDAGHLAADLRRFREFRPVEAAPPRLVDHLANWARRNRALAGGVTAVVLLLALAGSALGFDRYQRSRTVDRVLEQIGDLQQALEAQRLALSDATQGDGVSTSELARLEGELANTLLSLHGRASALVGFDYPRRSPRVLEQAREHTLELNDALLGMGRYGLVAANVRQVLESVEQSGNYMNYSLEEIDRLSSQQAEAEEGLASSSK